ncbi:hypothetical protein MERGE_000620 [Pneumocystis wakefieldiae]|uniref:Deacetylase sirtuin-type domain-containing protein n=1 Tax=Pneumocystis wakefieldiae TaxID=38082 RepID=A0A899G0V2_9ASCO|nr:hypothetical protein MERGE_000620 [Pneumocystis wakefieldiae]
MIGRIKYLKQRKILIDRSIIQECNKYLRGLFFTRYPLNTKGNIYLSLGGRRMSNQPRIKLKTYNTVEDVLHLIQKSQRILVITGAGISTSLGIPDFRSDTGIYSTLEKCGLSEPQEVFDINVFREDPSIFYSFASELFPPEKFKNLFYSPTHAFIKLLQDKEKLLAQYTQNVDNIEEAVGSFKNAICIICKDIVSGETIFDNILLKTVPNCLKCLKNNKNRKRNENSHEINLGVLKPNITFFGEKLPKSFDDRIEKDIYLCDLVICIGTSLKVAPVSKIINAIPSNIPQIYISRESVKHITFDITLLSNYCDDIVANLCNRLNWDEFYDIAKLGHKYAFNRMINNTELTWKKESESIWRLDKDL